MRGLAIAEFKKDTEDTGVKIAGGGLGGALLFYAIGASRPPPLPGYYYVYSTGVITAVGAILGALGTAAAESLRGESGKYHRIIDRCMTHEGYPVFTDLYRDEY